MDHIDALGGMDGLRTVLLDFYDRLYADVLVGFFFQPHPKEHLVEMQARFTARALGADVTYDGEPLRTAHDRLPILPGHFDRRHKVLEQVLADHRVPERTARAWLELDASLRPLILKTGSEAREDLLRGDGAPPDPSSSA